MIRRGVSTVVVCALIGASAAAQRPEKPDEKRLQWGRERPPESGACFYEEAGFRGRYLCIRKDSEETKLPAPVSRRIASIQLIGDVEVDVFSEPKLRGRSAVFLGDVANLSREGWTVPIVSLQVWSRTAPRTLGRGYSGQWHSDRPPQWSESPRHPLFGACFYEGRDFQGRAFCMPRGATYTSLPPGVNDRISSIRVFDAQLRIFRDRDFRGRSEPVRSNIRDLKDAWSDTVSSIRVF